MDEKDKQLCETTFAVESAKQAAKLGKDVASDIIRPFSLRTARQPFHD